MKCVKCKKVEKCEKCGGSIDCICVVENCGQGTSLGEVECECECHINLPSF